MGPVLSKSTSGVAVSSTNQLGSSPQLAHHVSTPHNRFLDGHLHRHIKKFGKAVDKAGEKKDDHEGSSGETPKILKRGKGDEAFEKLSVIGETKLVKKFVEEKEANRNLQPAVRRSQTKPKRIIAHKSSITKTAATNRKSSIFKCDQCPTTYLDRNLLLKHAADSHNRKVFECLNCQNLYTRFEDMIQHMKASHPSDKSSIRRPAFQKTNTKCTKCDLEFPTGALLLQHKKDKHNLKLHKCDFCANEYTNLSNMLRHRRKSHDLVPENEEQKLTTRLPRVHESVNKKETQETLLTDQFPVMIIEQKIESTENPAELVCQQLLEKVNQEKNKEKEKFEKDVSFFLHLNRYDPASI